MEINQEQTYKSQEKWPRKYTATLPGKAFVIINTDGSKITSIIFDGRPTINQKNSAVAKESKSMSSKSSAEDISHIMSAEVLRQVIKTKYEGLACDVLADRFKKPYMNEVKLECIGEAIAHEFLKAFQDGTNLHNSGSRDNQLSGALILLFKSYVEMGKERFEKLVASKKNNEPTIQIKIPDLKSGITSKNLQEFFGATHLFVNSWDDLLDMYFSVNYDYGLEIQRQQFTKDMLDVMRNRVNTTNKVDLKKACDARKMFLQAYRRFGLYEADKLVIEKRRLNNDSTEQKQPSKLSKHEESSDVAQKSKLDETRHEKLVEEATQSSEFFKTLVMKGGVKQLTSNDLLTIASNKVDSFNLLMKNGLYEEMEREDLDALKNEYDDYPFEGVEESLETLTTVIRSRCKGLETS